MRGRKVLVLLLSLLVLITLSLAGCGGAEKTSNDQGGAHGQEVTLKIFAAWPENNTNLVNMNDFIKKVEEKTNGTVKIVWGGGPEAIPSYQLAEAIKNGMVDIAWTAHTYNVSHIPVLEGLKLTDPDKMRANGGFEYVDSLYQERLNAHYLGSVCNGLTYNLYTNKEIKSLNDFKGMTIRATPAYQAFVESLGAGVVNTAPTEAYQALERNVIQGYGWPSVGIMDFGWQEVTKYVIEPAFYNVDTCIVISDKAWQKLDENQQEALKEAAKEVEEESKVYYQKAIADEKEKLQQAGMKIIQLPEDVAKQYLELAYSQAWAAVEKNAPEDAAKLKQFAE